MKGWFTKYHISKADGSPIDKDAVYMVLRLDTDKDAREAAMLYAERTPNNVFGEDIRRMVKELDK